MSTGAVVFFCIVFISSDSPSILGRACAAVATSTFSMEIKMGESFNNIARQRAMLLSLSMEEATVSIISILIKLPQLDPHSRGLNYAKQLLLRGVNLGCPHLFLFMAINNFNLMVQLVKYAETKNNDDSAKEDF